MSTERWSCGHEPDYVDGLCAGCYYAEVSELDRLRRVLHVVAKGYGMQDHTDEWLAGLDALEKEGLGR
jgi:hypothetical protein